MKKSIIVCASLCAALLISSCGSNKESAYRKAYEKALAQENNATQQPVTAPVVERPQQEPQTQPQTQAPVQNYDNVAVRSESVNLISGDGLKGYSVVVGSFGLKPNAEDMQARLRNAGYAAQIVFNPSNSMYRVVASTFDTKAAAVNSRDALRSQYADAWLLYSK